MMDPALPRRAIYRARQFFAAIAAYWTPLRDDERAAARAWLPAAAWPLFDGMPRSDQRHSLKVLHTLAAAGHTERGLMQAALLHDVAKSSGRVTLCHRVAVVLLKAVRPGWLERMALRPAPGHGDLRYPFWAYANHPRLGAEMAAAAGCDPLAVTLIRRHQEPQRSTFNVGTSDVPTDRLLVALKAADDDN